MSRDDTAYKKQYGLLKRFEAGVSGEPSPDDPKIKAGGLAWSCSIPDNRIKPYLGELVEGGFVLLSPPGGVSVADCFAAPLLDVRLGDDDYDKAPKPSATMLAGLQDAFLFFATLRATDDSFTGLDKVGLKKYLAYWVSKGARIGRRVKDVVVWEDTKRKTPIPQFEKRYLEDGEDDLTMAPPRLVIEWDVWGPDRTSYREERRTKSEVFWSVQGLRLRGSEFVVEQDERKNYLPMVQSMFAEKFPDAKVDEWLFKGDAP